MRTLAPSRVILAAVVMSRLTRRMGGLALGLGAALVLLAPPAAFSQAKPDLVVTAVTDPPATALPGDSFTPRRSGTAARW